MLRARLEKVSIVLWALYTSVHILLLCVCAYAYRKPFAVTIFGKQLNTLVLTPELSFHD